ncbi:MAG: PadR family transcriptional regulator [Acidobacteriota bacterium]
MSRDTLGEFEQLVLLAALRLGDEAYTVPIIDEIERRTGRTPTHAAVYVAMRRLEDKGLVRSEKGAPTSERGGRAKRYFRVEPRAVELLREQRDALLSMWEGLEEGT